MEEIVTRIKSICDVENLSREELAKKTGIPYSRWHNLMNARGKIRSDEIEATGKAWPEYMLWIAYAIENPSLGQYSPMSKKTSTKLDLVKAVFHYVPARGESAADPESQGIIVFDISSVPLKRDLVITGRVSEAGQSFDIRARCLEPVEGKWLVLWDDGSHSHLTGLISRLKVGDCIVRRSQDDTQDFEYQLVSPGEISFSR